MYTSLEHYIDGNWVKPSGNKSQDVINPSTSKSIGELGHASKATSTRRWPPPTRASRSGARCPRSSAARSFARPPSLVRARTDEIAKVLTQEQGKVLMEAKKEVIAGDIIDWYAARGSAPSNT